MSEYENENGRRTTTISTREGITQTTYRESDSQTHPYSPNYIIKGNISDPEVLLLEKYKFESGELSITRKELEMINYARERKKRLQNLPDCSTEESMIKRQEILEEIHRLDMAIIEDDIRQSSAQKSKWRQEQLHMTTKDRESKIQQRLEVINHLTQIDLVKGDEKLQTAYNRNLRFIARLKARDKSIISKPDLETSFKSSMISLTSSSTGHHHNLTKFDTMQNDINDEDMLSRELITGLDSTSTLLSSSTDTLIIADPQFNNQFQYLSSQTNSNSNSDSNSNSNSKTSMRFDDSTDINELINTLNQTLHCNEETILSTDILAQNIHKFNHIVPNKLLVPSKQAITQSRATLAELRDQNQIRTNIDLVHASTQLVKSQRKLSIKEGSKEVVARDHDDCKNCKPILVDASTDTFNLNQVIIE